MRSVWILLLFGSLITYHCFPTVSGEGVPSTQAQPSFDQCKPYVDAALKTGGGSEAADTQESSSSPSTQDTPPPGQGDSEEDNNTGETDSKEDGQGESKEDGQDESKEAGDSKEDGDSKEVADQAAEDTTTEDESKEDVEKIPGTEGQEKENEKSGEESSEEDGLTGDSKEQVASEEGGDSKATSEEGETDEKDSVESTEKLATNEETEAASSEETEDASTEGTEAVSAETTEAESAEGTEPVAAETTQTASSEETDEAVSTEETKTEGGSEEGGKSDSEESTEGKAEGGESAIDGDSTEDSGEEAKSDGDAGDNLANQTNESESAEDEKDQKTQEDQDSAENASTTQTEAVVSEEDKSGEEDKKDEDSKEDDSKSEEDNSKSEEQGVKDEAAVADSGEKSAEDDGKSEEDQDKSGEEGKASEEGKSDEEDGKSGEEVKKSDDQKSTEDANKSGEDSGEGSSEEDEEKEEPYEPRSREHLVEILGLDDSDKTKTLFTHLEQATQLTLKELKRIYENAIKPLETLYKYRDLSNRHFGDPEIFSKPLVVFMGPWSGGKSTTINWLLDIQNDETALRTGADPSPAQFNIMMYGKEEEVLDGTQLAADWTFSGLQKFGQSFLDRLRGRKLPNRLLEKVNIVEIPGILEVRKQVERSFPFNDACQWFIDRADVLFLVYDPAKLDIGPETEAILDQLKGRENQVRIVLNKADSVKPEELLRVQATLVWNISPLMSSAEPPIMYAASLWDRPLKPDSPKSLMMSHEKSFLKDIRDGIEKRVESRIAAARRFAVRVRNHAKMVDCYLNTYNNHRSFFSDKKKVSNDIIDHPQNYHIYEGLSTLTNISRYDLPDPDTYRDFFKLNSLWEFPTLSSTCSYFRGCPINKLDIAIAYELPEILGKFRRQREAVISAQAQKAPSSK